MTSRPTLPIALATGFTVFALSANTGSAQTTDEGLTALGVYDSGVGEGGSEIVAVDTASQQIFTTNSADDTIDVIDISDPTAPTLVTQLDVSPYGDGIQSVTVADGRVAAAVKSADPTAPGTVAVFTTAGVFVEAFTVGNLPDSTAFTADGRYIVVANEGEPICDENDDSLLDVDPEGTVSIIDTQNSTVATAAFTAFNGTEAALAADGIRIFFPGSTVAQDLEPEYVAISPDGATAYVTLQENNAIAVVDIASATVSALLPLGYKDHSVDGNGFDASNRDDAESITTHDVLGMYMPDAIVATQIAGTDYLVTANEGDSRDYDCFSEEERVSDFTLAQPPYEATDGDDEQLGRLKTTSAFPSTFDGAGSLEQIYSYGARSFTIRGLDGTVVFDSGDDNEQRLVGTPYFNLDDDETDGRSDDKGPEPEALAVGNIGDRTFAFVGLERSGGVMMYDITDPAATVFVDYLNTAEVSSDDPAVATGGGDVSPEGIAFIPADESPNGEPLIAVSFEVSGTTRLMQVDVDEPIVAPSTTIAPTTTVAATPTTVPDDTDTDTTVPDTTPAPTTPDTAPTTAAAPTDLLPATGTSTGTITWLALLLVGLGGTTMALTRRRF